MVMNMQYPISGPYKIYLIILEWIIVLLFFELAFGFLIRTKTKEEKKILSHFGKVV